MTREDHRAITQALVAFAHERLDRAAPPPAYVRRHLLRHARSGNVLDRVLDPRLLPYLDITRFWRRGQDSEVPAGSLENLLRRVALAWDYDQPAANAAMLALALAEQGTVADRISPRLNWRPRWVTWTPTTSVPLGSGHVATAVLPGGRVVAVDGDTSAVTARNLATGEILWQRSKGFVAGCGELTDGRVVLFVEDWSREERQIVVADLSTGAESAPPIPGSFVAAVRGGDGRLLAVVDASGRGLRRTALQVWDIEHCRVISAPYEVERVDATCVTPAGRTLLVTMLTQRDARTLEPERTALEFRDAETLTLVCTVPEFAVRPGSTTCLATVGTGESRHLVLVHGDGAETRAWDATTAVPEPAAPIDLIVAAVATGPLPDGGTGIVLADPQWRCVDSSDGAEVAIPLVTTLTPVVYLSSTISPGERCDLVRGAGPFLQLGDGREVAVTTSARYRSFLRDIRYSGSRRRGAAAATAAPQSTLTLPAGRRAMLTVGRRSVHIVDLRTGTEIGRPFTGHVDSERGTAHVHDARAGISAAGRLVAVSAGADAAWLWDVETREPIKRLYAHRKHGVGVVDLARTRDGRLFGVVGSQRADVATYDLSTGQPTGAAVWPFDSGDDYSVFTIATAVDRGDRPLAIVANQRDRATLIDLRTNSPLQKLTPRRAMPYGKQAAAMTAGAGGDVYILLGAEMWRIGSGRDPAIPCGSLEADRAGLWGVRLTTLSSGDTVAFTLHADGRIRAFSVPDGREIGSPLPTLGMTVAVDVEPDDTRGCEVILRGVDGWACVRWSP
ncbi:hypothetical protein DMB66_33210 [Actinoplanes sp. ATCC 53533]|uniref:hypothetical protein n=1 Tax=Actinoplanes sp. ATCC 53533 TaxID=1288362 RepID=UPI000F7749B0|nr:hypothetical protein [Actinoplanes sp. ATCC 53533]RSM56710.1 hypothetical protein DMB66_33210 [Actinoplanes sp. ATCC 53533]